MDGDKALRLGSRALEVLIALVERPGELVTKDELMARVWPTTVVEECNLKVHVAALRRALADGQAGNRYLATIPGRGYRFVAPITVAESASTSAPQTAATKHAHNLPLMLTRMVGRTDTVRKLAEQLPRQRFITIIGAAGVGTTSVALAVAEALLPAYEDGVWFVDLAPVAAARLVPTAVAAVFGLELRATDPLPALVAALRNKQTLLVLDNCEHVVDAAATLVVAVLKGAPRVHVLATSREPLRAQAEHLHRLAPLASPPPSARLTASEALAFPAVQLFVECAAASLGEFELSDSDAPFVADICSKLDGVPLAIEFAAARVDVFGVHGLALRLEDRLRMLTSGRRTALPRHQTMRATLDWSYEFLPELERLVLRRLAIFAGAFSLEAASVLAASKEVIGSEVADIVVNLIEKSLVSADVGGTMVRYRLLATTRAYALEKLRESGEYDGLVRRHAEFYRNLFEKAAAEWDSKPTAMWLADYARRIDEVRAALDWAFSPSGDASVGLALTAAAVPLWFQLSLVAEARDRVERALLRIESGPSQDARCEMQLAAAHGASLMYTKGPVPEIATAWTKALELADRLDDNEYQLRALWGLWVYRISNGEYRSAFALAQRFRSVAEGAARAFDLPIGDRMVGVVLHYLGNQTEARRSIELMLHRYVTPVRSSHTIRFQLDQRVTARVILARILWLQGFPDQAMRTARSTVEEARTLDHPMSLCYALASAACPVALFVGDLAAAEHSISMLLDQSTRHGLALWHGWGRSFNGALVIERGDVVAGLQLLRSALDEVRETRSALRYMAFISELAQGFGRAGQVAQGLEAIDEALERSERTEERWCVAELLRIKGELVLLEGGCNTAPAVEDLFGDALAWSRRQGVLSWELRTAISLARLQRKQGRTREAHDLLASVYGRFTEGFETADLLTAKRLLDEAS